MLHSLEHILRLLQTEEEMQHTSDLFQSSDSTDSRVPVVIPEMVLRTVSGVATNYRAQRIREALPIL